MRDPEDTLTELQAPDTIPAYVDPRPTIPCPPPFDESEPAMAFALDAEYLEEE